MAADPATRRDVLAGGFALAFLLFGPGPRARAAIAPLPQPGNAEAADLGHPTRFAPNAFIRIDAQFPVRLVMPNVEMGQGIYGTESVLLAEEMDLALDQVLVEHAPPNNDLYATPLLQEQATGGSTSVRSNWLLLRQAGAVARMMLVGAAAQRWGVDPASLSVERGVVRHAGSGRSASYPELASAAQRQPVPDHFDLKDPAGWKLIGKPTRRPDTAGKVNGSILFGIDMRVPGMKVASVLTCPVAGGTLTGLDESAARAVPGVVDIVREPDFAAVIADHFWAARKGVEALKAEWDYHGNDRFSTDALFADMDARFRDGKSLVGKSVGKADQSGKTIDAVYKLPMLAHAPMEPLNALVHVRPDACEIWVGTQVPIRVVAAATRVTGLPADKVILHNTYLGGGFGRRLEEDSAEQAIKIARHVSYPVKMIWTREQDIHHDIPRPAYLDHISAVVDGDGYPLVWKDHVTGASVLARWAPAGMSPEGYDSDTTDGTADIPYAVPNIDVRWTPYQMPRPRPIGWWRGVGYTHNLFVTESFVDELAAAAGKNPVDYRRHLLRDNKRVLNLLDIAADRIGWGGTLGSRVGRGIAVGSPFGSHVCLACEVEVSPQGEVRIRRAVVALDVGRVMNPNTLEAQAQGGVIFGWTAALYGKLSFENGLPQQSNFNDYRMLRINEVPPIEVHIVDSHEDPGGMGEVGTAIAAPALANAIRAATGVRIRELPIVPRDLVADKSSMNTVVAGIAAGAAISLAARGHEAERTPQAAPDGGEQK